MGKKKRKAARSAATINGSGRGRQQRLQALVILSVIGVAVAGWLLWLHFELLAAPGAGSACNFGGYLDCDAVNASQFADVGGVPIAYGALLLYMLLGWMAAL